jgi:O-methyltransferase
MPKRSAEKLYYRVLIALEKFLKFNIPATWLELDWTRLHPWNVYKSFDEHHHLNSFRRQNLIFVINELDRQEIVGDILECGVYKGFSSWILLANSKIPRNFYGVDSFAGLSIPSKSDGDHWKNGDLSSPIVITKENLSSFEGQVELYEGFIPEVFGNIKNLDREFALVHIDVDLYEPTKYSLVFGWENLVLGGILFCDDYGFSTCPGATQAVDEFIRATKNVDVVIFPTGGIRLRKI